MSEWCPQCGGDMRQLEPGVSVCLDRQCRRWRTRTRPILAAIRRRSMLARAEVIPFHRGGRSC